ncbi:hypothetical protein J7K24_01450 [bacterium]|nr:hypothetical protein [bacterium]
MKNRDIGIKNDSESGPKIPAEKSEINKGSVKTINSPVKNELPILGLSPAPGKKKVDK